MLTSWPRFALLCFMLSACTESGTESSKWDQMDYAGTFCKNNPSASSCHSNDDDSLSAIGKGKK